MMFFLLLILVSAYSGDYVVAQTTTCSSLAVPYNNTVLNQLTGSWFLRRKKLTNNEPKESCGSLIFSSENHPEGTVYRYERLSTPDKSFTSTLISKGLVAENPMTGEIVLVETSPDSGFTTFLFVSDLDTANFMTLFTCDLAINPLIYTKDPYDSTTLLKGIDAVDRLGVTDPLFVISQDINLCT